MKVQAIDTARPVTALATSMIARRLNCMRRVKSARCWAPSP